MNETKSQCSISKPFKVQINVGGKNDFMDMDTVYFVAPSAKNRDVTIQLKKLYKEAMFSVAMAARREGAKPAQNSEEMPTGEEIFEVLGFAKDFDLSAFLNKFCILFEDVAFKDEERKQRLLPMEIAKIDGDDLEGLAAKYIGDFLLLSWMKGKLKS